MAATNYGNAIRDGFAYLLKEHKDVFAIGQGLWSPWYVGSTMRDLDKEFGHERIIDTPVSEDACTGVAVGASLCGYRPIVIHPRMDFMILATNQIVNQAAKWSHMFGGQAHPAVTIRGIINRGGQQGAQHSQALHSWFSHVPGLRVVMPATPRDARDLLISAVLCDDPVLFIDDRWLYEWAEELPPIKLVPLEKITPQFLLEGEDITVVAAGYPVKQCLNAGLELKKQGINVELIDLRVINPINYELIVKSVEKTGRLLVSDSGWASCGLAGEIIAGVSEKISPTKIKARPRRLCTKSTPAPTSGPLEKEFYFYEFDIIKLVKEILC